MQFDERKNNMYNKELFELQRKRYLEGKRNTIGGVLRVNAHSQSEVHIPNKRKILRFHLKAESPEINKEYAIAHISEDLQDEASESEKEDVIVFFITYGECKKAGVSLQIGDQYYNFSPSSEGVFSLYFDFGYRIPNTDQSQIASFYILVDGRISENEVLFDSTNSIALSHILYSLVPTVEE